MTTNSTNATAKTCRCCGGWIPPEGSEMWDASQGECPGHCGDNDNWCGAFDGSLSAEPPCHCQCGEWSGEYCAWCGDKSETVVVEFMPEWHRASHEQAGNSGAYPHNGARRIRVERSCADGMIEHDGAWCSIVEE